MNLFCTLYSLIYPSNIWVTRAEHSTPSVWSPMTCTTASWCTFVIHILSNEDKHAKCILHHTAFQLLGNHAHVSALQHSPWLYNLLCNSCSGLIYQKFHCGIFCHVHSHIPDVNCLGDHLFSVEVNLEWTYTEKRVILLWAHSIVDSFMICFE